MWIVKMKVPNSSSVIWCCPVIATCCYQGNCKIEVFAVSANLYSRNTLQDAYHYSCPNLFVYVIVFRIKCKCLNNLRTSHVEMFFFFFFFFFFFLHFYILRWNIPTVRKHYFRKHLISNFHENRILIFACLFADSDTWVGLHRGYRESLWNAPLMCRRFQQSKVNLVIECRCIWDYL